MVLLDAPGTGCSGSSVVATADPPETINDGWLLKNRAVVYGFYPPPLYMNARSYFHRQSADA